MKFWILLCFLICPNAWSETSATTADITIQKALELGLDRSEQWLNLLNYRRDFFFWKRSQADSPLFFLNPEGRWQPREELTTFIRQVFNPAFTQKSPDGSLDERAQCLFPGRFLWLRRQLPKVAWPEVKCQRFENFRGIIDAHSATYVFSSYYLNNPSSAYGHSFLRLNRGAHSQAGKRFELIDFGVGYAAIPNSTNTLVYSVAGIFGFLAGRFDAVPYYYKVREYNDFENRDLWEYDLDLNQDEIDLLVAHMFELDRGGFDYLYTSENCAYRILAALDAVRPSLNLIQRTKIDVIPADSIRLVYETPGFVREIHYRPSSRAIFMTRLEGLRPELRAEIKKFSRDENVESLTAGRSEKDKQELLDAAMDFVDYRYADDVLKEQGRYKLKKEVLIKRSEVALNSSPLEVPAPFHESPGVAHGSAKFHFGAIERRGSTGLSFGHAYALHDLLDPVIGYPAYSQIKMMDFDATYDLQKTHALQLEEFNFVNIVSLSPASDFNSTPSWRLKFALSRLYRDDCQNCVPAVLSAGVGYSRELAPHLVAGLWIRGALAYSPEFLGDRLIPGLGPAFLGRYFYGDKLSVLAEAFYRYDYRAVRTDVREASFGAQYNLRKDFGLRLSAVSDNQYRLELQYYY